MRAYQYSKTTGGLEANLTLNTIPVPKPPGATSSTAPSVLVSIQAASLNPADFKFPEMLIGRLLIRRPAIPSLDFSGRIAHLPADYSKVAPGSIKDLKVGDPVVCRLDFPFPQGALAEYSLAQVTGLARLPENVSFSQGAAIPTAALTAYQALAPYVKGGSKVFINGGSGGVGVFAIQIAKALGAEYVAVTCSAANAELCWEVGADEVIDYRSVDVVKDLKSRREKGLPIFDHLVDAVPSVSSIYEEAHNYLREGGAYVQVSTSWNEWEAFTAVLSRWLRPAWLGGGRRKWVLLMAKNDQKALERILGWVSEGRVKVVIDSEYDFENVRAAFARLRTGRAKGKVVVNLA